MIGEINLEENKLPIDQKMYRLYAKLDPRHDGENINSFQKVWEVTHKVVVWSFR